MEALSEQERFAEGVLSRETAAALMVAAIQLLDFYEEQENEISNQ